MQTGLLSAPSVAIDQTISNRQADGWLVACRSPTPPKFTMSVTCTLQFLQSLLASAFCERHPLQHFAFPLPGNYWAAVVAGNSPIS